MNSMQDWFVSYEALGQRYTAGPYTEAEAEWQRQDISEYVGISNARLVQSPSDPPTVFEYLLEEA